MAYRGPGACTHCREAPGEVPCSRCKMIVCPKCAADRLSCTYPPGRKLQLEPGSRLRAVADTDFALVSTKRGQARLLDLSVNRPIDVPASFPTPYDSASHGITRHRRCYFTEEVQRGSKVSGWRIGTWNGGDEPVCWTEKPAHGPWRFRDMGLATKAEGWWGLAADGHHVDFCRLDSGASWTISLEKATTSACVNSDLSWAAVAAGGAVNLFRPRDGGRLTSIELPTEEIGCVLSQYFAALVVLTKRSDGFAVRNFLVSDDHALEVNTVPVAGGDRVSAVSHGYHGSCVAVGFGDGSISVADLISGEQRHFLGHTGEVCALGFAWDGSLISGDCDGGVHIRPRHEDVLVDRLA